MNKNAKITNLVILFSFIFLFSGFSNSTPKIPVRISKYYQKYNEAFLECEKEHFRNALKIGQEAELIWELKSDLVDLYILCYSKLGNYSQAKQWMSYAMQHYNRNAKEFCGQDSKMQYYYGCNCKNPIFESIINDLKKNENNLHSVFMNDFNKTIISRFFQLFYCCQLTDSKYLRMMKLGSVALKEIDTIFKLKSIMDVKIECIQPSISYILEQTIYPDESIIGTNNSYIIFDAIFINLEIPNKLKIMDKALYSGKMNPRKYARAYDRCIHSNYYGTIMKHDSPNRPILDKIPDVKNVDKRRALIGLPPIFLDISDYQLSDEYKKVMVK